jgi:hypothetical protein
MKLTISGLGYATLKYTAFHQMFLYLELDCPLSGAKCDIGFSHSLYNQAPKKLILYEKQYR